jgi:hypothetical protein
MRYTHLKFFILIIVTGTLFIQHASAVPFNLVTPQNKVSIVYDKDECKLDSIVANLLAGDIKRVSGYQPQVYTDISRVKGNVIIIGSISSRLISGLGDKTIAANLNGKWECYSFKTLTKPSKNIKQALVIAGSDFRGTAYGVFELSSRIGVTPWYWWADANPEPRKTLSLNIADYTSETPSVKFRGIFINDEDWGLQPWAAKTFEPETGDIGPKTYAKVFELLLRLKANFIWPAMHPSTKAFFHYPGNAKVAADYQIVIGSSHAEPMLRNNVGEWNEKTMGAFNYVTNKQKVDDYWESRVKESSHVNAIYTIGMRGVHDSGIEGVKTVKETVPLLERIFQDQRNMLKKYVNPDITKVPQAFTAYKEVLDVYDGGLKVPDDVTLVWPDDNYGYIQRLDDQQEAARSGGSGIYYHVSYWGRPHDYIWLSSTSPGLIREEMTKAYDMNTRNIWVVNVGDIKPAEYNIQLFMDMAYHIQPFKNSAYPKAHLQNWVSANLGSKNAGEVTNVLWKYYQLAFERKPEFMGWSQTEPNTPVHFTDYNHQYYGDQAQQRADAYTKLEQEVKTMKASVPASKQDAYFQLVYYPVVATSLMNKKFLYRDKAFLYARQGRISARNYDSLSRAAYQGIINETDYYNTKLSGGKWANIMSMKPRGLAVYQAPGLNYQIANRPETWAIAPEGDTTFNAPLALPAFNQENPQKHFADVFLCKDATLNYTIKPSAPWINVSQAAGKLSAHNSQSRLWVSVDWAKAPAGKELSGSVNINAAGKNQTIAIKAIRNTVPVKGYKGFVENDGYISIFAKHYQDNRKSGRDSWAPVNGFGATETSLEALPLKVNPTIKGELSDGEIKKMPVVSYNFYTFNTTPAEVKIFTIPTYPLNRNFEMRYAVSVDNGPATIQNFKTVGRSEEWKQDVLSNSAVRSLKIPLLGAGKHTLQIYLIDPGVILDRMLIDLGGLKPSYGLIPETKLLN